MPPDAPQQTISYLARRFSEAGVQLNSRNGQNFLLHLNLLRLAVDRAQISPQDVILEVGAGTGSLTALLAARAAAVVSVEIDPQLWQLASEELVRFENVVLLNQDALKSLDASLAYHLFKNISLTLDGVNLTEEEVTQFASDRFRPRAVYDNGRYFFAGIRWRS